MWQGYPPQDESSAPVDFPSADVDDSNDYASPRERAVYDGDYAPPSGPPPSEYHRGYDPGYGPPP
ncbi:hypothetical protein OF83DRAFT_1177087, partial [Amylostereum chailletii]